MQFSSRSLLPGVGMTAAIRSPGWIFFTNGAIVAPTPSCFFLRGMVWTFYGDDWRSVVRPVINPRIPTLESDGPPNL